MNLIWDIILQANDNGIDRKKIYFKQASEYSPYLEQSFACLNENEIMDHIIEINILYRFSNIFKEILHPDFKELKECFGNLYDIMVHYLAEIDLKHGLNKREYYIQKIIEEIKFGFLGEKVKNDFIYLEKDDQYEMANSYLSQMQMGSSLMLFRKVLVRTFPNVFVYQSNRDKQKILVYIGDKRVPVLENKMDFIINTFLPVRFHVRVFWEYHFEIIDVDATMILENTVIF